jgi:hypothetical protein
MTPFEWVFHVIAFLVLGRSDGGYPTYIFFATEPLGSSRKSARLIQFASS